MNDSNLNRIIMCKNVWSNLKLNWFTWRMFCTKSELEGTNINLNDDSPRWSQLVWIWILMLWLKSNAKIWNWVGKGYKYIIKIENETHITFQKLVYIIRQLTIMYLSWPMKYFTMYRTKALIKHFLPVQANAHIFDVPHCNDTKYPIN